MKRAWVIALSVLAVPVIAGTASASFPGHNGSIAFTGMCGGAPCIKVTSVGSSTETTVPRTTGGGHAHYSPSGKVLVFDRQGTSGCCNIYTARTNGTHVRRLTHGYDDEDPAWSPDGKQIVFSRQPQSGTGQLYVMNADGTHLHKLIRGTVAGSEPDWSVKGLIAFQGKGNDIYVVTAKGTHVKDLTKGTPSGDGSPSWSPDGKWIAFIGGTDVWRMTSGGTQKTNLTNTSSFKDHPCFSPDGKLIVYQDNVTGSYELWVIDTQGDPPTQLTHDNAGDTAPNWQPR